MAEYGEWTRKGASLSDVTAKNEYGVDRDFIVRGIRAEKLEYREGVMHGNPYLKILRGQLEKYIADELSEEYLLNVKHKTELQKVRNEITGLNKKLNILLKRKTQLESLLMDH